MAVSPTCAWRPISEGIVFQTARCSPFLSVFSTADLTVYAALLCLGVFKQFDGFISRELINENEFHLKKMLALFIAIVLFATYAMMKVSVLSGYSAPSGDSTNLPTLTAAATTSIVAALFAVFFSLAMRWKLIKGLVSGE